jgi:hypothetical protein
MVFEAVMTDARVTTTGARRAADCIRRLLRFAFDVTDRVFFGNREEPMWWR